MNDIKKTSKSAFQVAPSPLNAVKLELAIILISGFILWMVLDSITNDDFTQIGVLFLFSVTGSGWLVLRIRQLLQRTRDK